MFLKMSSVVGGRSCAPPRRPNLGRSAGARGPSLARDGTTGRLERGSFPSRIHRALRPKGMLHLGMKLGHDAGRDALGRYVTYYSEADLTDLTQAAGFTALRSRRGNRHDRPGAADTFVIVTAHG